MSKTGTPTGTPSTFSPVISPEMPGNHATAVAGFFASMKGTVELPEGAAALDFFSDLIRGLLNVDRIERGGITCSFSVEPPVSNYFKGLHGGVMAAIVVRVATACARTVVAQDKELFLGELSTSYLSSAPINAKMVVAGSLVRSGRSITVVSVEFRLKETRKLVSTAHATFFNLPASKL